MAAELNSIFNDQQLSGLDVKTEISNLSIEYKRKKKEQSGTGASPCSWPYFDSIDKLLGERPYMDDSLLTDSIKIEEELVFQSSDTTSTPDIPSNQVSKQADDSVEEQQNPNDSVNSVLENSNDPSSTSTSSSIPNTSSSKETMSKRQKKDGPKKKRASDAKTELVQQLVKNFECANDAAARSESKMLELLEKQTTLQEMSLNNQREFRSVFKNGQLVSRQCLLFAFNQKANIEKRNAKNRTRISKNIQELPSCSKPSTPVNLIDSLSQQFSLWWIYILNLLLSSRKHDVIFNRQSMVSKKKFQYPMCLGALDGTHIPIKAPRGRTIPYSDPIGSNIGFYQILQEFDGSDEILSRSNAIPFPGIRSDFVGWSDPASDFFTWVVMLATVNSDLLFTYVNVGAPGRCNDASIYSRCILSEIIEDPIYSKYSMKVNNVAIQSHLIADSAFALNKTLLKPFAYRVDMPKPHSTFNYRLSRARCSVERAFGALKNRFRLLHRKLEFDLKNTINIIKTAAILRDICCLNNDQQDIDWELPVQKYKKLSCKIRTGHGVDIRSALMNYFLANPL
ncbi:unnamed protein product [Adineta ricciae]|uniref:DDE Tnp4 domain-containing protein n=1 Tax=Adineta ricciae TaxID=249248 RepID=A0A816C5Z2_ADIRI|nr:unnamed protein product [Adineta ricciae]